METEVNDRQLADEKWLEQRIAFEENPENRIVFIAQPSRWHPQLISIRNELIREAKKYEEAVKKQLVFEERQAKRKRAGKDFDLIGWSHVNPSGLLVHKSKAVPLRVTALTYQRALAIANMLFFAAEDRGFGVGVDGLARRLILKFEQANLSISIRERQDSEMVKESGTHWSGRMNRQYMPTDRLAIVIDRLGWGEFAILDNSARRVEDQLNAVFVYLYRLIVTHREQSRRQEVERKREDLQRIELENIARQRAAVAQAKANENARKAALLAEASNWHRAQQIREFVAHVASHPDATNGTALDEWVRWAMKVAQETDAAPGRISALNKGE